LSNASRVLQNFVCGLRRVQLARSPAWPQVSYLYFGNPRPTMSGSGYFSQSQIFFA